MPNRTIPTLLCLLFVAVLALSACQSAPLPSSAPPATPIPPTATPMPTSEPPTATTPKPTPLPPTRAHQLADQLVSKALEGNLLNDPTTRRFKVLLPPNYFYTDKRYPVVYVLPWGPGYAGQGFDGFEVEINLFLKEQPDKEMIFVSPDASNALGASLFRSSATIGDYETYITHELVEYVDSHYRTLPNRENRGIGGCSNGGDGAMHLALKYPDIYSVAAPAGGTYIETPEQNSFLLKELGKIKTLPEAPAGVSRMNETFPLTTWYIQLAAGVAPNPDNPPLYLDMPFQMVDGQVEIVPEVSAKMTAADAAHLAEQTMQQPQRLNGLLIQHALQDVYAPTELVRAFDALLTKLGIEHQYVEDNTSHCFQDWEMATLQFMAEHLLFDEP